MRNIKKLAKALPLFSVKRTIYAEIFIFYFSRNDLQILINVTKMQKVQFCRLEIQDGSKK
jgi:hypothetical protein